MLHRPKAVFLLSCAVFLSGAWVASQRLAIEWTPSVTLPVLRVSAAWPGTAPRTVERFVTAPIERALQGLDATRELRSQSRQGLAYLELGIDPSVNPRLFAAEVSDRLESLRTSLPEGVVPQLAFETPEALRQQQGFMTLQLLGPQGPRALLRLARDQVVPRLRSLEGIGNVDLHGGEAYELRVEIDDEQLRGYGLQATDLRRALSAALTGDAFGRLQSRTDHEPRGQFLIWTEGATRIEDLANLPLPHTASRTMATSARARGAPLRLGNVATVTEQPTPLRTVSRVDGQPAVTLLLTRAPGSHLLSLSRQVRAAVDQLQSQLPAGSELRIADDRSDDVRHELRRLAWRSALGLAGVVVVLGLMLRRGRATAMVLWCTAVAVAIALMLLPALGLTLNVLTLAGLALLIGLLVDNAAVLVEQVLAEQARLRQPPSREQLHRLTRRALGTVGPPLLGGTATTVAVLFPLVYLSGELRSLFAPFAVLTTLTLTLSLVVSLLLVGNLSGFLWASPTATTEGAAGRARQPWARAVVRAYGLACRYPRRTLLLFLLAVGLPTPLLPDLMKAPDGGWGSQEDERQAERYNATIGSDPVRHVRRWLDPLVGGVTRPFLDEVEIGRRWEVEESREIRVFLELPAGSDLDRTDTLIRAFEQEALAEPTVHRTLVQARQRLADLRILFEPDALELDGPYQLRNRLISLALQHAGIRISVSGLSADGYHSGLGVVADFTVEIYGSSYDEVNRLALDFAARLRTDVRVADVDPDAGGLFQPAGQEQLRLRWPATATAYSHLSTQALTSLLRPRLLSYAPDFYAKFADDPHLPVRLVSLGADRLTIERLLQQPFTTGATATAATTGRALQLASLTRLEVLPQPPAILRDGQQYQRNLRVYYRGPSDMGWDMLAEKVRTAVLPPGYRMELTGLGFSTEDFGPELLWLVLGTILLVLLILAAVVESWRLAAIVLLSLPAAWIGISLGFVGSGENFAEGAFLGTVLTVGIAVNDGLLLANRFQILRLRHPWISSRHLALVALRQRLRPMWTTTLSSAVGLLPLLIDTTAFWSGLAIAVGGGLLASTLIGPAAMIAWLSLRSPARIKST